MDGAIAVEALKQKQKLVSVFSEKVCFVSRVVSKHDDDYSNGCHIFVVDLSELVDGSMGVLEPNIILDCGFGDSVCGLDSTLYFAHFAHPTSDISRKFYALDIQTHQSKRQQQLDASDLLSLPPMLGRKSATLLTPIPATKKILVFSSWCRIHCWDPDRVPSRHPPRARDDDDDDFERFVDFEMYDIETNSWEKLPDLIIRMQPTLPGGTRSYFWHQSFTDKRGIQIPSADDSGFRISRYTFIDNDTVFLVQLNCGAKLTLNLKSPSRSWKLYNEGRMLLKPCTSHQNHLFLVEEGRGKRSWCASHIGGDLRKFGNVVSFPLSSFCQDEQVKQHKTFSTLTPLEGDKGEGGYVCIVQGGVSRKSRHGLVIIDVMDVKAKNQPQLVASCRFEVMHHYKTFWPFCMFVYHSN